MKMIHKNLILILLTIALAASPLIFNPDAEYAGADSLAEAAISEIRSDYTPWFNSLWEPPSGEIESLLFSLQAALGSGVVFYYLGYKKGEKRKAEAEL